MAGKRLRFLQRAKSPQIVTISEWVQKLFRSGSEVVTFVDVYSFPGARRCQVPPFERQPEEALELYMKDFG